jgi:hypothetical protein
MVLFSFPEIPVISGAQATAPGDFRRSNENGQLTIDQYCHLK